MKLLEILKKENVGKRYVHGNLHIKIKCDVDRVFPVNLKNELITLQPELLDDNWKEFEYPTGLERVSRGNEYFYLELCNVIEVCRDNDYECLNDNKKYNIGNYFNDKKLAEFVKKEIELLFLYHKYSKNKKGFYYIEYKKEKDTFIPNLSLSCTNSIGGCFSFESVKDAEAFLNDDKVYELLNSIKNSKYFKGINNISANNEL